MHKRALLFAFLAVTVLAFVAILDRWGQEAFLNLVFTSVAPAKVENIRESVIEKNTQNYSFRFPNNFLIGTSSSAYQIEGGWDEGGKTPSIWDDFVHNYKNVVFDNSTADIGPDSYHNFKDDVRAIKLVGFQHYRFSISWSRIIPNGSATNQEGIDYYSQLIDELVANNIEPMITMFHWDLPVWLQNLGGLTNEIFVEYFTAYADILFHNFGVKVKYWMTMNEPFNFCTSGYGTKPTWAPAIKSPGIGEYLCGHNMLLAHAAAFHLYKKKYYKQQKGSVGITLDSRFYYAKNSSVRSDDLHRAQNFRLGWFSHPIFSKTGGYPKCMIDEIGARSKIEERPFSRLPDMDQKMRSFVRGTSDFFGLNYYTSRLLAVDRRNRNTAESPAWFKDSKSVLDVDKSWKCAKSEWLYSVPHGFKDLLNWIKDEYDNPPVLITENGWSDDGQLEDDDRIDYYKVHLKAVSEAIENGCNIIGYTAWSLLDNFEWDRGYLEKFGLFAVNMTSPKRERTPKKSALFFKNFMTERTVA